MLLKPNTFIGKTTLRINIKIQQSNINALLTIVLLVLNTFNIAAQNNFPIKGLFKQISINYKEQKIVEPQIVHGNINDKFSFFLNRKTPERTYFSWHIDEALNIDDPLCFKFIVSAPEYLIFSWYNTTIYHSIFTNTLMVAPDTYQGSYYEENF